MQKKKNQSQCLGTGFEAKYGRSSGKASEMNSDKEKGCQCFRNIGKSNPEENTKYTWRKHPKIM